MTESSPWWDRDVYADRRPFLLARGRILTALREWFRRRGFLEVETPALQVSPGNETHLHAFATELCAGRRAPAALPAHLAGVRLQEAARRRRGAGVQLRPRVPQSRARAAAPSGIHHAGMVPDQRALRGADGGLRGDPGRGREAAGCLQLPGRTAPPIPTPSPSAQRRRGVRDIRRHRSAGDADGGEPDRDALAAAAQAAGIQVADDDTWSDMFSRVLVERIEPQLGIGGRRCSTDIRCPRRRWRSPPTIRGWRSASSSMPAASSWPTASAS